MAESLITSLDDPRLEPYRALKQSNLTRWSGVFIAEGVRVVERLLESRYTVQSVFVSQSQRHRLPADLGSRCEVYTCPQSLAELVVGYRFHTGVLACARRPENPPLEALLQTWSSRSLLVGCPNTTDPDNLGTILRVAAAFGAGGLLLGRGCCDPYSRRSLRVSMGSALALPVRESEDFVGDLNWLGGREGFQIVASVLDARAVPLAQAQSAPRTILLLGNEADGLPGELVELADQLLTIPMAQGVDSLNVGVAAGVLLHHLAHR